jgi:hypothetical protein
MTSPTDSPLVQTALAQGKVIEFPSIADAEKEPDHTDTKDSGVLNGNLPVLRR